MGPPFISHLPLLLQVMYYLNILMAVSILICYLINYPKLTGVNKGYVIMFTDLWVRNLEKTERGWIVSTPDIWN